MEQLTERDKNGTAMAACCGSECKYNYCCSEAGGFSECRGMDDIIDRLAAIEDILGDEYDMDRLRELVENDKSCYTCKNYKGEMVCGFKGLDMEINPQEGCVVREAALRREQDD